MLSLYDKLDGNQLFQPRPGLSFSHYCAPDKLKVTSSVQTWKQRSNVGQQVYAFIYHLQPKTNGVEEKIVGKSTERMNCKREGERTFRQMIGPQTEVVV